MRILVVDDHEAFGEALEHLIAATPNFVMVGRVSSGEEAVEAMERLSPQFILMDVVMPGMGGIAAARTIMSRHPEVGILLISLEDPAGYLDPEDRSDRLACRRKQALSAHELAVVWDGLNTCRDA
ncbi:MAG: response regulator transcription factor [Solirubrobacteraceae bacterium]